MKINKSYIAAALVAMAMSVTACFQPVEGNTKSDADQAPSPITEDMINREACVSLPGEYHIIFKSLPQESNMLYVKAEYKVDNGQTIYKTMSVYSDTLVLEGFGSNEDYYLDSEELYEYPVKLYSVSRGGSESEALETYAYSQGPAVDVVAQTLSFQASFSSMVLSCKNPQGKNLNVYAVLDHNDEGSTLPNVSKVYAITSEDSVKTIVIDNLPGGTYEVTAYVTDSYGNQSDIMGPFTVPTLSDERIIGKASDFEGDSDPRAWTFLSNNRLYGDNKDNGGQWNTAEQKPYDNSPYAAAFTKDSLRNAIDNYSTGKIKNFWDGVTEDETVSENTYSHFWTGNTRKDGISGYWAYPYSYFIDLGRDVKLSRIIVHQAWDGGKIYSTNGTKVFQLWGRADGGNDEAHLLDGWELIGTYTIVKPLNEADQKAMFLNGHTFDAVSPDEETGAPRLTEKAYRYIRFKGLEPFDQGKETTWHWYSESTGQYYYTTSSIKNKPADAYVVPGAPYQAKMAEITFYGEDSFKGVVEE